MNRYAAVIIRISISLQRQQMMQTQSHSLSIKKILALLLQTTGHEQTTESFTPQIPNNTTSAELWIFMEICFIKKIPAGLIQRAGPEPCWDFDILHGYLPSKYIWFFIYSNPHGYLFGCSVAAPVITSFFCHIRGTPSSFPHQNTPPLAIEANL